MFSLVNQALYLGLVESEKKEKYDFLPALKLVSQARRMFDSYFEESDTPFNVFLALIYQSEAKILQRYIETRKSENSVIPRLSDYEFGEKIDEEYDGEEECKEDPKPKRRRLISGDGSSDDPWMHEDESSYNQED